MNTERFTTGQRLHRSATALRVARLRPAIKRLERGTSRLGALFTGLLRGTAIGARTDVANLLDLPEDCDDADQVIARVRAELDHFADVEAIGIRLAEQRLRTALRHADHQILGLTLKADESHVRVVLPDSTYQTGANGVSEDDVVKVYGFVNTNDGVTAVGMKALPGFGFVRTTAIDPSTITEPRQLTHDELVHVIGSVDTQWVDFLNKFGKGKNDLKQV